MWEELVYSVSRRGIAIVIKTAWYWWREKQTYQWRRIKKPGIDSHRYTKWILSKGAEQFNGGRTTFLTNNTEAIEHPQRKKYPQSKSHTL